ncbi:hypothetical protein BC628DRAFT_1494724 [Trametes gibbosa]|nr:hypothetical protein BC628DRAFT_1504464 [Trametes gibbosa]KAI0828377.1 hypothetical protein BC628DRAFT_1494724 [Trametes gibbosa]
MPDECPPEVADIPSLRAAWHLLDDVARAAILQGMHSQSGPHGGRDNVRTHRSGAPALRASRNRTRLSSGGHEDEGYGGDQERGTNRTPESRITTRRSIAESPAVTLPSGPDTIRRRISRSGAYIPIDPVLLQQDQEAAMGRTQQLEARMLALEAQVVASREVAPVAPVPARTGQAMASRGRGGRAQRRRRPAAAPANTEDVEAGDVNEVFCPDADAVKDGSDPLRLVSPQHRHDLSAMQRQALSKCQAVVQGAFREVTGVLRAKDPWPKWSESEDWTGPGLAVNFSDTVKHPVNRVLFRRVAAVAMQDLKKDSATHAIWMNAPDVKLTIGLLIEVAKATFRGFKTVFLAQEDADAKQRLDANAR